MSRRALMLVVAVCVASACGGAAVTAPPSALPSQTTSASTPTATRVSTPTATPAPTATPTVAPTPSTAPTASPTPVASGAAPYCTVADIPTPITAYPEHVRTYLDWTYMLPDSYAPPDLVSVANGRTFVTSRAVEAVGAAEVLARRGDPSYSTLLTDAPNAALRQVAYEDFLALRAAASAAGAPVVVLSAYRSYALQATTFDYWVRVGGYQQALRTSARAGHSEHQLGTAIDFGDGSAAPWEYADWASTATGAWLAAHAVEFGFVMSYPKGRTNVTCYDYEPWHYRYVGKALAQSLSESRVTLREYQSAALR